MSFKEEAESDVPQLPEVHSGIPSFLLDKARDAKRWVFETRTKPQKPRERLPVVPQGVDREAFLAALDEIRLELGSENVEVNDKPLKDGWLVKVNHSRLSSN
jgi:hypothetical protein